jgi:hypothetical protein
MSYDHRKNAETRKNYKPKVQKIEEAIKSLQLDLADVVRNGDFEDVSVEEAAYKKLSQLQKRSGQGCGQSRRYLLLSLNCTVNDQFIEWP